MSYTINECNECYSCHGHGHGCPTCNGKGWMEYEIDVPDLLDDAFHDVANYPFTTGTARNKVDDWVKKDDPDMNEYIAEAASEAFYDVFLNRMTPEERMVWIQRLWDYIDTMTITEAQNKRIREKANETD